ncbi:MAG: hypothetical protein JWP61_1128 [Friedmanniella sp.]|nr:hypothetical protein [Friedmanniella sp.]
MRFDCDGADLEVDERGRVTAVRHRARPELVYLADVGGVEVDHDRGPVAWSEPDVSLDTDEVEVRRSSPGLILVVRHTFAAGWGLRVALTNTSDRPVPLERLRIGWAPGPSCVGWALTAGATGAYAVQPADAAGPVLGGLLTLGDLDRVTASELVTDQVRLAPGGRYVLAWQWSWSATPRQVGLGRQPEVPETAYLTVPEPARLPADDDRVLLRPSGVAVERVRDTLELMVGSPGTYPVELRTARGTTRYDLVWAAPVAEVLAAAASEVLAGPRTAAGIVRLASVDAALVLQHALRTSAVEDPEAAAEALDLFVARLGEEPSTDPRTLCLLAGEFGRTGDPDALAGATAGLLEVGRPAPGLGLAGSQVAVASVLAGRSPGPVMEHLAGLVRPVPPGGGPLPEQVTDLELRALCRADGAGPPPSRGDDLTGRLLAVGTAVGSGLRGRPLTPLPLVDLAHLAAVLTLLPEPLSLAAEPVWGCTAHQLAHRLRAEVVARLEGEPLGTAHAWLALGSTTD